MSIKSPCLPGTWKNKVKYKGFRFLQKKFEIVLIKSHNGSHKKKQILKVLIRISIRSLFLYQRKS